MASKAPRSYEDLYPHLRIVHRDIGRGRMAHQLAELVKVDDKGSATIRTWDVGARRFADGTNKVKVGQILNPPHPEDPRLPAVLARCRAEVAAHQDRESKKEQEKIAAQHIGEEILAEAAE